MFSLRKRSREKKTEAQGLNPSQPFTEQVGMAGRWVSRGNSGSGCSESSGPRLAARPVDGNEGVTSMTETEKARLARLDRVFVGDHALFEERDRLRELEEINRLGPEAVAAKKHAQEARYAAYVAAQADYKRQAAATTETFRRRQPSWARALIVAECRRDRRTRRHHPETVRRARLVTAYARPVSGAPRRGAAVSGDGSSRFWAQRFGLDLKLILDSGETPRAGSASISS